MSGPTEAFWIEQPTAMRGTYVLTCEHANNHMPPRFSPTTSDQHWLAQHWGWDIGIADVTSALSQQLESVAVYANFSRLICDPNRAANEPTWLVEAVEGTPLSFNQDITPEERAYRRAQYYDPYHQAVDGVITKRLTHPEPWTLLAMHSFTRAYKDTIRTLEIGVLYDDPNADQATTLVDLLRQEGFLTEHNEPYSGKNGMIYSAWRHGTNHNVPYLELEIRQDLIDTKEKAEAVATKVGNALTKLANNTLKKQ
jgi:predicted N-formylglutamate amidohydrolase